MPLPSAQPPTTYSGFTGAPDTLAAMVRAAQGPRGERSMLVRTMLERLTDQMQPKDYAGEIVAVRNFVTTHVRYQNDPLHVELVKDPQRLCEEIVERGIATGDCFPEGTLLLRDDYELIPIEDIRVGERIWGHDDWCTVEAVGFKGVKPVSVVCSSTGSLIPLTRNHKLYLDDGERITVDDIEDGATLLRPDRIAFADVDETDPDWAYVRGLYVADGWCEPSRVGISGQDGCLKEEQKRRVAAICAARGIPTSWSRKYIRINDASVRNEFAALGRRAPEKELGTLRLGEADATALMAGILADAGRNTNGTSRTFSTTSRKLAAQVRVLLRMHGIGTGWRLLPHHGDFGENAIYRLGMHEARPWSAKVRGVEHDLFEAPCWDIQTSDHRVYLPEHDVTVSNCDDMACLIGTMALQLGRDAQFVAVGFKSPGHYSHVFCRVKDPKSNMWIVCDPVAGTTEGEMLSRVTTYLAVSLDEPPGTPGVAGVMRR